ncbi:hypothetical protein Q7C36_000643 [Tachysurus vachellii]|uniref:Uncharacterized protein n=1 Tax=Tachysurus vachellii TaxID=175792 RepID=A0AA88T8C2_TACVA|nr:hypothetical protein Q7C36_000643 [Tachysurus vachellii]
MEINELQKKVQSQSSSIHFISNREPLEPRFNESKINNILLKTAFMVSKSQLQEEEEKKKKEDEED